MKKNTSRGHGFFFTCSALALCLTSQTAAAQAADESGASNSDIIVTAQKRDERLQDVPASIAVLTGESLEKSGAVNYADYLNSIPSVSYAKNSAFKDKIFIRGLSDTMSSRVLATTGLYLDETPITEVDASLGDLGTFDVSRVEVLRGPQGTLFGSGSMGGTVRIITNKPDLEEYEGLISGQISSTRRGGTNYDTNAMANLPIVPGIAALRVVGGYRENAGFIDNLVNGETNIDSNHASYVRGMLAIQPTENLDILLAIHYQKSKAYYGPNQDRGLDRYTARRFYPEVGDTTTRIYNATINYSLPFATITSASSWINKDSFLVRDLSNFYRPRFEAATGVIVPNAGVGLEYHYPNRGFTQELRVASAGDSPLTWVVGGYYNNFHPNNKQVFRSTIPALANFDYQTSKSQLFRRELAGFGEASYAVTDQLSLTAGVRHSIFKIGQQGINTGFASGGTVISLPREIKQTATVMKFRADYKITPDNMVYAVASQGYRPGGLGSTFNATCLPQLQQLGYATPPMSYDPDRLWNFEVGTKNQLLDRKLTLNADAYYIKWKNTQVAQNLQCGAQFISNAGGAISKGVELEIQAHPSDALDLTLGGAFTDATFDSTDATIRTEKGAALPNVPRWTVSSSAQYNVTLGDDFDAYVRGDVQYVDSRYSDLPLATTRVNMPSYIIVNARVGFRKGPWELDLFAQNLTNELAVLNVSNTSSLNYETINQPRTLGVAVRRHF